MRFERESKMNKLEERLCYDFSGPILFYYVWWVPVSYTHLMLVATLKKLNEDLGIPANLTAVGVTEDKLPEMVADAMKSGNILRNPRQSTSKDVEMLYRKAL